MHLALLLFLRVTIGSLEHLLPIGFSVLFTVFLIRIAKQLSNQKNQFRIFNALAIFISLSVLSFHVYYICFQSYDIKTDLPLYLCSLLALLIPVFSFYRKYWMFEILVFWIIAGTLQGVLTPDIAIGFPSLDYFRYWIVHLGLLSIIFYAVFVFKMKPKFKSVFKSFFALQLYIILIILINFLLDANYFYLNEKPKSASLLDYFGEWPFYLLTTQIIIIPFFYMIYLVFNFFNKDKT